MMKIKPYFMVFARFIKHNLTLAAFAALFLSAILFYSIKLIDFTAFAGAFVSIATLYYGSLKNKIENDILFKELFKTFNERYDSKINDLLNELRANEAQELTPANRNLIIDYFNLCAEEYLWKTKRRIPADVWRAWKAGMKENLQIKQVREVFDAETESISGRNSYYGLYDELTRK